MFTMLSVGYFAVVAWLCLYVPWVQHARGRTRPLGYALLWEPPDDLLGVGVDVPRLLLSLVALTAVFAAALMIAWRVRARAA